MTDPVRAPRGRIQGTPSAAWRGRSVRALRSIALGAGIALACPAALAQEAEPMQQPQPAADSLNVEILVLHGTNDGKGIDRDIGDMPELGKPPFSSYNSYKVLKRQRLTLNRGKPESVTMPND